MDVVLSSPQERVQNRTPVQVVGVPAPQIMEGRVLQLFAQERVQNAYSPEQIVRWSSCLQIL